MSGRSVNLTTLFLGRLRPPKRLTSTSCTYFRQAMFQRKYDEHYLDIDETIVTELLEHENLRVDLLDFKILEKSEK